MRETHSMARMASITLFTVVPDAKRSEVVFVIWRGSLASRASFG